MKRLLRLLILSIIPIISFAQHALIEIPFTFSDGAAGSIIDTVGIDPLATDGIDPALGETYAPPFPPPGGFDAKFQLPTGNPADQTYKDIREGDNTSGSIGEKVHTVIYQLGAGNTGFHISWNLPFGVELNLKDAILGTIFNVDFPSGPGNYTVPSAFTSVIMTVKYIIPPFPVELTSFTAVVINETVQLNWETATEVNNYGFDIERKTEGSWHKIGFVAGNGNSNSPKEYSFIDKNPYGGSSFVYRLKQIDNDGAYEYYNEVEVDLVPGGYELFQNYPNPFNPSTNIKFSLPEDARVSIKVYDILGSLVDEIVNKEFKAGYHQVEFDASSYKSGIYFYRLEAENFVQTKKMNFLK